MLFCHCQCRRLSIIAKMSFLETETKLFIDSCDSGQRYSDTRLLSIYIYPAPPPCIVTTYNM